MNMHFASSYAWHLIRATTENTSTILSETFLSMTSSHGLERNDWTLTDHPEWDKTYRCISIKSPTVDIEGAELTVVVAASPEEKRIVIKTAW